MQDPALPENCALYRYETCVKGALNWSNKNLEMATNQLHCTGWCSHSLSLIWVPLESLFHALFKHEGYCRDLQVRI